MATFFKSAQHNNTIGPLAKIDSFYKSIISQFPVGNRISYCESLIYRTQEDLRHIDCGQKKRMLKKRLKAAQIELEKINTILFKI
ncbi:MAG: hypothetical protein WBG90_21575 [Saonia sp.]